MENKKESTNIFDAFEPVNAEFIVGRKIHELRAKRNFSLRQMAERSGLNINTLSMIENGKTSPSVSTLQRLSVALGVPITSFFESDPILKHVVFSKAEERSTTTFNNAHMQNLGKDLAGNCVQPFVVTLEPGAGSGNHEIVHTGHEFVYCLFGSIHYKVGEDDFDLGENDSLVFEAHRPHSWENSGNSITRILLVLYSCDEWEEPGARHFKPENLEKEQE